MTNAEKQKRYRERRKALRGDENVTDSVTIDGKTVTIEEMERYELECPHGHDKKMWEYACERALRARNYAQKMPEHIRPGDLRFQDPMWQYEDQMRYPLPMVKERE